MNEPVTKDDILKVIQCIGDLKKSMEQRFDQLESKLDHTVEEVVKLREEVNGIHQEKFEIKRVK